MRYFLIRQNNALQHLPDFCLLAHDDAAAADGPDEKKRAHFVWPHTTTELPLSFLVVDEEAIVRVCSGRMLKTEDADFVLTGIVTDEYEAPYKMHALEGIHAAIAAIPN